MEDWLKCQIRPLVGYRQTVHVAYSDIKVLNHN